MRAADLVRVYGWLLGAGLLLEGGALLLLDQLHVAMPGLVMGFATGDVRHNALHVVWGAAILVLLATSRAETRALTAVLAFGIFYVTLGFLGLIVDRPFGLLLGPGENVFHLTVGPLALALGARSIWRSRHRAPSLISRAIDR